MADRYKRSNKKRINYNQYITVPKVRLIDESNQQRGIIDTNIAINMAKDVGLDLVEVSPNTDPPVCKIINFGKYRYEKQKQVKKNKKNQHVVNVKEIRIRPNTNEHDLLTKLNKAQQFLLKGDKLKITVLFRGREVERKETVMEMLKKIAEVLSEFSVIDKRPNFEHRRITMILSPK